MWRGSRRRFLGHAAAGGAAVLAGCAGGSRGGRAKVVVIGGGFGGATTARFLRLWAPDIDVTLVERDTRFISCPISNLVLGGHIRIGEITMGYDGLRARGVQVVHDEALAVDPVARRVRLAGGATLDYDRLVVSPSVDMLYDKIPGLKDAHARESIPHAWKAGAQTIALRRRLTDMRDGGVFAIHIPVTPFRCPPGPYERVCQIASYFKAAKPRSTIIVLDSNPDIASKPGLFRAAWKNLYPGMIDYRPNSELADVDVGAMTVKLVFDDVKADVINVIPPQRAGAIALAAGLIAPDQSWCEVDWLTLESVAVKGVHVLGDATFSAPAMPKSATMANQHAKVCAAAVIALIRGEAVNPQPVMMNTCYSFADGKAAMHVASVHAYDPARRTMLAVKGTAGVSPGASEAEGAYAWGWARNIWAEALA